MQPNTHSKNLTIYYAIAAFVFILYTTLIVTAPPEHGRSLYALLADAFLAGQTYLKIEPDPRLLHLPLPHTWSQIPKGADIIYEGIVYNGKYYLPYGPIPALLLFAPYKWLTGSDLNQAWVVWLFACIGTGIVFLLFFQIASRLGLWGNAAAPWLGLALGIGTFMPYLIRRPLYYEIASVGAYTSIGFALILFLRLLSEPQKSLPRLCVFSGCLGLAAGFRLHFVIAGILLLVMFWAMIKNRTLTPARLGALFFPWGVCIAALAWYNWTRFGSIAELGNQYHFTCDSCHLEFEPKLFFYNLYDYLFKPIHWNSIPPFLNLRQEGEPHFGVFPNAWFLFWLLGFPGVIKQASSHKDIAVKFWLLSVAGFSLGIFLVLTLLSFSTLRYRVDFMPWWMLLACLGYLALLAQTGNHARQRWLFLLGIITLVQTLLYGLALGYMGEYGLTFSLAF